ncbi:hypothetical protein FB451DRAFT_1269083 [Mycena latifolia]|nr:hypothetical protein FB451DRAFT_1269083 [Mycena latifolia]
MQGFPQELTDLILDQVAEQDRRTGYWRGSRPATSIATCGLVCKQWLPRSRLHIFFKMVLYDSRLKSLLDLEAKSSIPLLSLTRDLLLVLPLDADDMPRIRDCLCLTRLNLCPPRFGDDLSDLFLGTHLPFLGTHCVHLSHLKLTPCEKSSVSVRMIADILTCLPSLGAFELEGGSCTIIEAHVPLSHSCPPRLHTLDIDVKDGVDILFAWLLSLAIPPRIKSLTLSESADDDPSAQSLVAYCQRFGSALEFLSIWPLRASFDGPYGILKHATMLLNLKLHCQPIWNVLTTLSALPFSNLCTLAIELAVRLDTGGVDSVTNLDRVPYALIDEALTHPRFHSLESFSLTMYNYGGMGRSLLSRKARALMPLAKARGILHRYSNI